MKAIFKVLSIIGLSALGLLSVLFLSFWALTRWEYHLPSERTAKEQFAHHRAEYARFVFLLQRDPGAKVIDGNGDVDAYTNHSRYVPEYRDLINRIGAKSVMVREDGSIEFQQWGFGCAPCTDSFMGIRYSPVTGHTQYPVGGAPRLVQSLDDKNLPKDKNVVAGLYVVPLDREWSIYRLIISD